MLTTQLDVGTMIAKSGAMMASMALEWTRPVLKRQIFPGWRSESGWKCGAWTRTGMVQKKKTAQGEQGERDVHVREKRRNKPPRYNDFLNTTCQNYHGTFEHT